MKIRILSAIVLIASVSCTKLSTDEPHRATDERQPTVSIRFASEPAEPGTKAFFDSSTETWEKALGTLTVLVFDNTGALMVQRDFTSAELSAKKALFAIPKGTAGTTCDFYAVANTPVANITTKTGLLALLESSAADYNGTSDDQSQTRGRVRHVWQCDKIPCSDGKPNRRNRCIETYRS